MKYVGRRKAGEIKGTHWWKEDVKEAIAKKKDVHKAMCKSRTEANTKPDTRT